MQPAEQDLSNTYQGLPDDEIASLYAQLDSLTEIAGHALAVEIQRRKLSAAELEKMHSTELRREAGFDRREKIRRKGLASRLLFRGDPKGTIVAFIVLLAVLLILALMARHR